MISVVMAVGPKRKEQLTKTLYSIRTLNTDTEYEVMCVLDRQTPSFLPVLDEVTYLQFDRDPSWKGWCNPASVLNFGIRFARGEFLILQNPENLHCSENNLSHAVAHIEKDPMVCVLGSCAAWKQDGTFDRWYCHSEHRPAAYPFFMALRKEHALATGGFNETFQDYGNEDIEFAQKLEARGVKFVFDDTIRVAHQWHAGTGTGIL